MKALLLVREYVKKIYSEFEYPCQIIVKFLFSLIALSYLTSHLGFYEVLNLFPIRLFIAVICGFIPVPFTVLLICIVALGHLFKLSVFIGALALIVFLIVYFMYLRFAPSQGIFMIAIAVLTPFNLQYAVAFLLGMFFGPVAVIPAALTYIVLAFSKQILAAAPSIGSGFDMELILSSYQQIINGLISDKTMVLMIVSMAVVIVLTYIISRMPFDYSWYVAIVVAAVANIFVCVVGKSALHADISVGKLVAATVIGVIPAVIMQFLKCVVDYPKKVHVQFEDDDYYYYVKAVPKMSFNTGASKKVSRPMPEKVPVSDETMIIQEDAGQSAGRRRSRNNRAEQSDFGSFPDNEMDNFDFFNDDAKF